jgi:3-oxoacyl-[acyl-carrier protein] reductase
VRRSLEHRVVVVTGGARGIGESTARRLAEDGARLALWDRDGDRLAATAKSLSELTEVEAIRYEQGELASVEAAAAATMRRFGAVDGLVNNAAIVGPTTPV